jgi:hypothetical protein
MTLVSLAESRGMGFRRSAYEPVAQGSLERDHQTDCWTHAWNDSRTYVEGRVLLNGRRVAHAWVIDSSGGAVEVTPGYESARSYMGFVIDRAEAARATATWAGARSSVLETAIAAVGSVPFSLLDVTYRT